jgi:MFS family permease
VPEEKVAAASDPVATVQAAAAVEQPGFLSRTFQAFRYRDFRLMWTGAFTSTTGTWMQTFAQSWLVLELAGVRSPYVLGWLSSLGNIPILLFSLVGGVVADRMDRRKALLASQYTQMTCAFILTLLVYFKMVHVWHMMILVFVAGTGMAFGGPAYQALIPGLVDRKDLSNAVALNSIQFNLARVIGPFLAGIAMAMVGGVLCFFLNGLSFLAVIASLYMIRATFQPPKTSESVMEGMRAGFAFIRERGALWQLTVLGFVSTFCGIPLLTQLLVVGTKTFHLDAKGCSYMLSVSGIGSIVGALTYAGLSSRKKQGLLALRVQLTFAVLLAGFALSHYLPFSYLCLFFCGMCLITLFASVTSLVQLAVTEEMRGRVMSIFMLAFRGGMVFGDPVAGYFATQFSPAKALLGLSFLLAVTACGFLVSSSGVKEL